MSYRIFREHFRLPPCFCIAPQSFQADRSVMSTDTIILPERAFAKYEWRFSLSDGVTRGQHMGRRHRLVAALTARETVTVKDQVVFDCRFHAPDNFAHFLSTHMPLLAAVSAQTGVPIRDIKVILPRKVPGYIAGLADLFGLDVMKADHPVAGRIVTFDTPYKSELRVLRRTLIEEAHLPDMIAARAATSAQTFEGRYFIARRGARALENHDEVSACLEAHGYQTVYMEDLPLVDQFKLLQSATSVVGIHGAGLATLFYANRPERLQALVELQPVGLASTIFREMAHALNVHYVTVRGKLKRNYVPAIYDTVGSYMEHQNDTFSIDTVSLEQALDFAQRRLEARSWLAP